MSNLHYPVMNREVIAIFRDAPRRIFIDCTVGTGGHSQEILNRIPGSAVVAIDEDEESLDLARKNLACFAGQVMFHHGNFLRLFDDTACDWEEVGGLLVDPGLSMAQLREGRRGFSHTQEGPLDMRKDRRQPTTAYDVVNRYAEDELAGIFSRFGEAARSREMAKKIIEKRLFSPISTTTQLRQMVEEVYHWRPRAGRLHPAARIFQALRIFINHELEGLEGWMRRIPRFLLPGTRLIFLAYHSLEDRIFKQSFRSMAQDGQLELIKPFPQFACDDEIRVNPASRSARLRAAVLS